MAGRVRVYIACSLDGFIAGEDDDLSWLPQPGDEPQGQSGFDAFYADVGAVLMGRRTYDVVASFEGSWLYEDRPVLVPTHRPLEPVRPTVRPVAGSIEALVAAAREAAGGRDVYVDGGDVIRQALDARLLDELTITVIPVVLGSGIPLFAGASRRHALQLLGERRQASGMVELVYRPQR